MRHIRSWLFLVAQVAVGLGLGRAGTIYLAIPPRTGPPPAMPAVTHSAYRGWDLATTPDDPWSRAMGQGARLTRPHRVVMLTAATEAEALAELRRRADAIEDGTGDAARRGD